MVLIMKKFKVGTEYVCVLTFAANESTIFYEGEKYKLLKKKNDYVEFKNKDRSVLVWNNVAEDYFITVNQAKDPITKNVYKTCIIYKRNDPRYN